MVGTNHGKCEWVWEEKLRFLNPKWPNSRWQNSRWLPQSSWVRINEFESDWISLSQSQSGGRVFLTESEERNKGVWFQHGRSWIQDGRIHDGHLHQVESEWMSLNQIELVWVRVRVEWECVWVNLREENKVSEFHNSKAESNMAEFEMAEFNMATINKLSLNEWVKFFLCKWWGDVWVKFFSANGGNLSWQVWVSLRGKIKMADWWWPNSRWQISRGLPSYSESKWISLSQRQDGVRVFWVNLREDNKVSESKMTEAESKMAKFKMMEFKIAINIKLSQNEWVNFFFGANGGKQSWQMWVGLRGKTMIPESKMAKFKMAAIIKLSENELVWVRVGVEWEYFWVNLREENKMSEFHNAEGESKMAEFNMAAIIKFSENEWVKFFVQNGWNQVGRIEDGCLHQVEG